jgi:C4-dicarboxylate transporter DctM subunit
MFLKALGKFERACVYFSAAFIFVMMVLTTLDTFLRDVFNHPLPGVYELHSMLIVGVLYLGMAYVQSQRSHIKMDLLTSKLSPANNLLLQALGDAIFLCISGLITWKMGLETWTAFRTGDFFFGVVKFPLWPAKLAITLGMATVSLRLISDIVQSPLWQSSSGISPKRRYFSLSALILIFAIIFAGVIIVNSLGLSAATVGVICLVFFLFQLFIGVPVAASMAFIGVFGIWMMTDVSAALGIAGTVPYSSAAEYTMTVLPLFVVMGIFAGLAGFAEKGFDLAKRWLENIKGGVVYATVIGSTIFAAATGSGAASCTVLTKLTLPEMLRHGVKKGMAIGVIASASTLAIMIPPSTSFVIYAMLTGNSIGKLLIAGIIPGLIGAALIMIMVYLRCRFDPTQVKKVSVASSSWKERFSAIPGAWGIVMVIVIIIGGIFTGFFTPTEAGAIGAFVTFLAVIILKRKNRREIPGVLKDSAGITSTILFILVGGIMFGNMLSISRLPAMMSEWIVGLNVPPIAVLIIIMFIYFILGCLMDSLSIMIITLPIIYPLIIKLGFNPIWFGVLMIQNLEISVVTPPYGMNLFILKGLLKDTSMGEIFRAASWFVAPMVVTMAIYIAFPQVALWLPGLMTK